MQRKKERNKSTGERERETLQWDHLNKRPKWNKKTKSEETDFDEKFKWGTLYQSEASFSTIKKSCVFKYELNSQPVMSEWTGRRMSGRRQSQVNDEKLSVGSETLKSLLCANDKHNNNNNNDDRLYAENCMQHRQCVKYTILFFSPQERAAYKHIHPYTFANSHSIQKILNQKWNKIKKRMGKRQ